MDLHVARTEEIEFIKIIKITTTKTKPYCEHHKQDNLI